MGLVIQDDEKNIEFLMDLAENHCIFKNIWFKFSYRSDARTEVPHAVCSHCLLLEIQSLFLSASGVRRGWRLSFAQPTFDVKAPPCGCFPCCRCFFQFARLVLAEYPIRRSL